VPFFDISPLELIALLAIAIMLFGPDKLPGAVQGAARTLRQFREFTRNAQADLKKELGPEFENLDLADLHPKNFVRKNLLGSDGVSSDDMGLRELREITDSLNGEIRGVGDDIRRSSADSGAPGVPSRAESPRLSAGERPPYDADAT
jgi:sec-independent protein translocase protein TatB